MLMAVSVCDSVDGSGNWVCSNSFGLASLIGLLKWMAPTQHTAVVNSGHQVKFRVVGNLNADGDLNDCYDTVAPFDGKADACEANPWWEEVLRQINDLYLLNDGMKPVAGQQRYYFGMVRPGIPGGTGGMAVEIGGRVAAGRTSVIRMGVETNDQVVAHETAHMLGAQHTHKDQPAASCYNLAWDDSTDWALGKTVCSGVDLWLNTPLPSQEASGTSGMKAAMNGVPSMSVLDGWWVEGHVEGVTGWAIKDGHPGAGALDDAGFIYDKLESAIMPLFYQRPEAYGEVMRWSIALNGSFFNAQRMLRQYLSNAYFPGGGLGSRP